MAIGAISDLVPGWANLELEVMSDIAFTDRGHIIFMWNIALAGKKYSRYGFYAYLTLLFRVCTVCKTFMPFVHIWTIFWLKEFIISNHRICEST